MHIKLATLSEALLCTLVRARERERERERVRVSERAEQSRGNLPNTDNCPFYSDEIRTRKKTLSVTSTRIFRVLGSTLINTIPFI